MAAEEMTPGEEHERLEVDIADLLEESTGCDILTLAQSIVGHVLNALDPAEIGARWTPEQWGQALEGGRLARRMERIWSCSHCGPSLTSQGAWCDRCCGRDYNKMTAVGWRLPQPKEGT